MILQRKLSVHKTSRNRGGSHQADAEALQRVAAVRTARSGEAPARQLILPDVSYSVHKSEVNVQELRKLYHKVQAAYKVSGSPTKQQFFQHWQHLSDAEAEHKLQLLLDKSVAVVAAFSRDSQLGDDDSDDDEYFQPSTSGRSSGNSSSSSSTRSVSEPSGPLWARWQWRKPRRLVGFVRAAGDSALVATIHDVLIHPKLQGCGLGRVLMQRCVNQVSRQGVFDVGLVAPAHLQPFFRHCSFDLDREESVPMAIRSSWRKDTEEINAQLQANPALQKLLHTAMDDEQRRLFTRC